MDITSSSWHIRNIRFHESDFSRLRDSSESVDVQHWVQCVTPCILTAANTNGNRVNKSSGIPHHSVFDKVGLCGADLRLLVLVTVFYFYFKLPYSVTYRSLKRYLFWTLPIAFGGGFLTQGCTHATHRLLIVVDHQHGTASCNFSNAWNFEMARKLLKNMCTLVLNKTFRNLMVFVSRF